MNRRTGSVEQLAEIGRRVPKPIVANMIEGGGRPCCRVSSLPRWAFS